MLVLLGLLGVLPWMILDLWILQWVLADGDRYSYWFYAWSMALLVTSQAHVATSFVTRYLGDAMFEGRPRMGKTIREVFKTSFFFVWAHGGLRLLVPVLVLTLMMNPLANEVNAAIGGFFLPLCVGILMLVRALRPFCSEMLLLERTPILSSNSEKAVTYKKRSRALHLSTSSDLFGRFLITSMVAGALSFGVFSILHFADETINFRLEKISFKPYLWAISLWVVAGFVAVSRFLSYVDVRIRQEGWAVELRMRAEAQRMTRSWD